jgi:hypothetical protein
MYMCAPIARLAPGWRTLVPTRFHRAVLQVSINTGNAQKQTSVDTRVQLACHDMWCPRASRARLVAAAVAALLRVAALLLAVALLLLAVSLLLPVALLAAHLLAVALLLLAVAALLLAEAALLRVAAKVLG